MKAIQKEVVLIKNVTNTLKILDTEIQLTLLFAPSNK